MTAYIEKDSFFEKYKYILLIALIIIVGILIYIFFIKKGKKKALNIANSQKYFNVASLGNTKIRNIGLDASELQSDLDSFSLSSV